MGFPAYLARRTPCQSQDLIAFSMMSDKPRVFMDTSVLFAAVLSPGGESRALLELGETRMISLWVGSRVLAEADQVVRRKIPQTRGKLAQLLEAAHVQIGPQPEDELIRKFRIVIEYLPDAYILADYILADYILAEAEASEASHFVTLDRKHLLSNADLQERVPFWMGTPGDFPARIKGQLYTPGDEE